jgi:hypothetical protein
MKPFSGADLQELQTLLHVDTRTAIIVAMLIHEAALNMRATREFRKLNKGKSDIDVFSRVAGYLKYSANYFKKIGVGHPLMRALEENGLPGNSADDFVTTLTRVSQIASNLANDPKAYRRVITHASFRPEVQADTV